jgi:uncharacterized cupin superfamily protein
MGTSKEAPIEQTSEGKRAAGEGWYVLNAREARWSIHEKFGSSAQLEGAAGFGQVGVNIRLLQPGQPNCHYHRESEQEDFLVLAGECIAILEGHERRLGPWDFVHCPPGTDHVFVGAGEGPCLLLMLGARNPECQIVYPVEPAALRYGAGVERETTDPRESYAGLTPRRSVSIPSAALALMGGAPAPAASA